MIGQPPFIISWCVIVISFYPFPTGSLSVPYDSRSINYHIQFMYCPIFILFRVIISIVALACDIKNFTHRYHNSAEEVRQKICILGTGSSNDNFAVGELKDILKNSLLHTIQKVRAFTYWYIRQNCNLHHRERISTNTLALITWTTDGISLHLCIDSGGAIHDHVFMPVFPRDNINYVVTL